MSNDVYQQKLDQAVALIEEHNAKASSKVDAAKFIDCLKTNGATSDETLKFAMYEDLTGCGLPVMLARRIVETVFRKSASVEVKSEKPTYISDKKALAMTIKELVERYDPVEHDGAVGKRLKEFSKGEPCIAFNPNGGINVELSAKEIKHLRDGEEAREFVKIDGRPTKLFRIGERLGNLVDENPLYPGLPLRDGECGQSGRSWDGISDTVRQLLYLAVSDSHELKISQTLDAHNMLDSILAKDETARERFVRERFPSASLAHDELKAQSKLPTLKLVRGATRKQDPFHRHFTS